MELIFNLILIYLYSIIFFISISVIIKLLFFNNEISLKKIFSLSKKSIFAFYDLYKIVKDKKINAFHDNKKIRKITKKVINKKFFKLILLLMSVFFTYHFLYKNELDGIELYLIIIITCITIFSVIAMLMLLVIFTINENQNYIKNKSINKDFLIIILLTLIALVITEFELLKYLLIVESLYGLYKYSIYIEENINNEMYKSG